MSTQATGRARLRQESCTAKLAKFFPEASPVRIPVRLTRVIEEKSDCSEETVIEFGTHREILFSSTLPLELLTVLPLKNSDGSLNAEASVVALQYTSGAPP